MRPLASAAKGLGSALGQLWVAGNTLPRLSRTWGSAPHHTHTYPARGHSWLSGAAPGSAVGRARRAWEWEGEGGRGREGKQVAAEAGLHPRRWVLCPADYVLALSARQDEKQVLACRAPTQ